MLHRDVFGLYDVNKSGKLGLAEFVLLLRDNDVSMDYGRACRILELFSLSSTVGVDFAMFLDLLAGSARRARAAAAAQLAQPAAQPAVCEAATAVPRSVFNSYSASGSRVLDGMESLSLFTDLDAAMKAVYDLGLPDAPSQIGRRSCGSAGLLCFDKFVEVICELLPDKAQELDEL